MAHHEGGHRTETVPVWDGNSDHFNEFEDRCLWYERGLSVRDRPQAVARVVGRLTGTAWKVVKDLSSTDQHRLCEATLQDLTAFLRSQLLEMGVPEVGQRFGEYLGRFHRKPGQSMREYVQHHKHLQLQVENAIKGAEKKQVDRLGYAGTIHELIAQKDSEMASGTGPVATNTGSEEGEEHQRERGFDDGTAHTFYGKAPLPPTMTGWGSGDHWWTDY